MFSFERRNRVIKADASFRFIIFRSLCFCFRYDVWLVDWRGSCDLPWAVYQDYTMDECAAYDVPAAIEKVLEITQQVS